MRAYNHAAWLAEHRQAGDGIRYSIEVIVVPATARESPVALPGTLPSNTVRQTPTVSNSRAQVSFFVGRLLSTNTATTAVTTGREALHTIE